MSDHVFNIGWLIVAILIVFVGVIQAAKGNIFFIIPLLVSLIIVWFSVEDKLSAREKKFEDERPK